MTLLDRDILDYIGLLSGFSVAFHLNCNDSILNKLNGLNESYCDLESMKWLIKRYGRHSLIDIHCTYNLECMRYLYLSGFPFSINTFLSAIRCNRPLHIIEQLHEWGYSVNCGALVCAVGNLFMMKWCKKNNLLNDPEVMQSAALCGDLTNIKWLSQFNYAIDASVMHVATNRDCSVGFIKFLLSLNCPFSCLSVQNAASNNNLKVMQLLYAANPVSVMSEAIFMESVNTGNKILLDWLLSINCPSSTGLYASVGANNLSLTQYLYDKGCRWKGDSYMFILAVRYSNIVMMEWLYQHHCVPDKFVMESAIHVRDKLKINYLLSINCPFDAALVDLAYTLNLDLNWTYSESK